MNKKLIHKEKMTVSIPLRLTETQHQSIKEASDSLSIPMQSIIRLSIERGLKILEKQLKAKVAE